MPWYFPYLPICVTGTSVGSEKTCANLGSLAIVGCVESTLCAGAGFHWQQITFFRAYLVTDFYSTERKTQKLFK